MTVPKIAPCPYCTDGGTPQSNWWMDPFGRNRNYCIECCKCDASGPSRTTLEQAIADWNAVVNCASWMTEYLRECRRRADERYYEKLRDRTERGKIQGDGDER